MLSTLRRGTPPWLPWTLMGFSFISIMIIFSSFVHAKGTYQTNKDFINEAFKNKPPKSQTVWIKSKLNTVLKSFLGHPYRGLRIRYWQAPQRSVWILEEIGKTEPITFGIIVANKKIENIKVLAFRESRGDEIRHLAFTRQFLQAKLKKDELSQHIDGISGATLSVNAMRNCAKVALYLDQYTESKAK